MSLDKASSGLSFLQEGRTGAPGAPSEHAGRALDDERGRQRKAQADFVCLGRDVELLRYHNEACGVVGIVLQAFRKDL